jgi:hypothetical protein
MEINAKEVLYAVLDQMGKEAVESTIVSNPLQVPALINRVCERCMKSLSTYGSYDKAKVQGEFLEAVMHYLLATAMVPSERKVKYNDLEIDLVIPSVKQLQSDTNRALVILFPKILERVSIRSRLQHMLEIQPNKHNIWLVLGHYDDTIDAFNGFTVFVQDHLTRHPFKPFSSIMNEINEFVERNKVRGFKIFRT